MRKDTLTLFVFGSFLALFSLGTLLCPKRTFSQMENRPLATMPTVSVSSIADGSFATQSESYLSDHAFAKDALVTLKNDVAFAVGQRQLGEVYVLPNGSYLSSYHENRAQLDRNIAQINTFAERLPDSMPVSLLTIPNAVGIYPERVPAMADSDDQSETLSYLSDQLSSRITLVNPYDRLVSCKDQPLYYKTDHHWTMRGAYEGYASLLQSLHREPLPLSAFGVSIVSHTFQGSLYSKAPVSFAAHDDIAVYQAPGQSVQVTYDNGTVSSSLLQPKALQQKDQYTVFTGGNQAELQISSNAEGDDHVLILKDSYTNCMLPYLATAFSKISVLDLRYFRGDLTSYLQQHGITRVILCYNIDFLNTDDHFLYLNQ